MKKEIKKETNKKITIPEYDPKEWDYFGQYYIYWSSKIFH